MTRLTYPLRLAVTTLALFGFTQASPVLAQTAPKDLVPFKATLTGPLSNISFRVVIPLEPPLIFVSLTLAGEASFLGQSTFVEHHTGLMGVDGVPRSQEGVAVLSNAGGDALFIRWQGLIRSEATPGALPPPGTWTGEHAFLVTGGRGRFLGATGNGVLNQVYDFGKEQISYSWDGMISRPK